jgi:Fe2+ transport system protein FeoA
VERYLALAFAGHAFPEAFADAVHARTEGNPLFLVDLLRYLRDRGVAPGAEFEVIDRQPFGGPLFVRFGEDVHPLGGDLARAMRVEVDA